MTKSSKRIEWEARIKDWKSSGLSVAKWCRENGHKDHQMYYWIQKIDGSPKESKPKSPSVDFLPVKVTSKLEPKGSVLIHLNQISVEVQPDADIHLLSKVLHVLQS